MIYLLHFALASLLVLSILPPKAASLPQGFLVPVDSQMDPGPMASAELPPQIWSNRFTTNTMALGHVAVSPYADLFTAGTVDGHTSNSLRRENDLLVRRYDSQGQQVWEKRYGGSDSESVSALVAAPDENIYVAGTRQKMDQNGLIIGTDAFLVVFDVDGNVLWQEEFGGVNNDFANGLAVSPGGSIYVAGETGSADGSTGGWLVRYRPGGGSTWVADWQKPLDAGKNTQARSVAVIQAGPTVDEIVFVGGLTDGGLFGANRGKTDYFLARFDESGSQLSDPLQGGGGSFDAVRRIIAAGTDAVYVTGTGQPDGGGERGAVSTFWVARFSWTGAREWVAQPGSADDVLEGAAADSLGTLFLTGHRSQEGILGVGTWVMRMRPDSSIDWREDTANASHIGFQIASGPDGSLYLIRRRWSTTTFTVVSVLFERYARRRPVLVLPGIIGSYYLEKENTVQNWSLVRAVPPTEIQLDPLLKAYHNIMQTLRNAGYVDGLDLFAVSYDWRLTPAPLDGNFDGNVQGITASSITDADFEYGVDYLGYWLVQAVLAWKKAYPNAPPLDGVDIITHSTGGLLARAYIQSAAYGGVVDHPTHGSITLPRVNTFIMAAVPNRGASQPWSAMANNFIIDGASRFVISKMFNVAYQKVIHGATIQGFPASIDRQSIQDANGDPDPRKFIIQYVPTMRSLLATYPFIVDAGELKDVNSEPELRNNLLLDLNNGYDLPGQNPPNDPSLFRAKVGTAIIAYSDGIETKSLVERFEGIGGWTVPLDWVRARPTQDGEIWYEDVSFHKGDGTVPVQSSVGLYLNDERFIKIQAQGQRLSHTEVLSNLSIQRRLLELLGHPISDARISLDADAIPGVWTLGAAVWDPIDGFLVDAKGRRLGYSAATGVVEEIPGSVWYGQADGVGWILGEFEGPLRVELSGLGGDYYVQVAAQQEGVIYGVTSSGNLGTGEKVNLDVPQVDGTLQNQHLYLPILQR